jgi:hypothetical protein
MARGEVPEETEAIKSEMWDTVISVRAASATEITAQQHALSQLSSLDQHRLTRIRQNVTNLGALVCSPGRRSSDDHFSLHVWRGEYEAPNIAGSFFFAARFSLAVAIADIHRPPQGLIHVRNGGFLRAGHIMQVR